MPRLIQQLQHRRTRRMHRAPANNASPYHQLVVRTQSPYQPATSTSQYPAPNYGGQAVGGTGPDATAVGSNPYSVRQAAITEPQLPPQYQTRTGPDRCRAQGPAPAFGPPPIAAAPRSKLCQRHQARPNTGRLRKPAPRSFRSAHGPCRTTRPRSKNHASPASSHFALSGRFVHADVDRSAGRYGCRSERSPNRPTHARRRRELRRRPRRSNPARRIKASTSRAIQPAGTTSSAAKPGAAAANICASKPPRVPKCNAIWLASPNRICSIRRTAWA